MRGHDQIVAARMAGVRFSRVDIDVADAKAVFRATPGHYDANAVYRLGEKVIGRVAVGSQEVVARLDLRCVHGLPVFVWCEGGRSLDVLLRAAEFSPTRVLGMTSDGVAVMWQGGELVEIG